MRQNTWPTRSGNSKHCTSRSSSRRSNELKIFRDCVTVHSMSSQKIFSVANFSEIAHVSICQPSVLYGPSSFASCGAQSVGAEILKPGGRLRGSKLIGDR